MRCDSNCTATVRFLISSPGQTTLGVCGSHLAWGIRHFGDAGTSVTVTNVQGENIDDYRDPPVELGESA